MAKLKDTGERLIPEGHHQTLTYGEHLARYLSVRSIVKDKTVLDVASGTGYGTQLISRHAKKVYGVDYSPEAIEYAKEHYGANNIEYSVGDAQDISLPDNSVDIVVSLETIEHLKDPAKFVSEVKRVLKADGQFIVSTPNDDEFIEGNEFHLHEFDLSELQRLIKKNFKTADFYYQGTYFGAALLDKSNFSSETSWSGEVSKTFNQPLTKAIYYLAVASDAAIERLDQTVVLADAWSTKDDIERDITRRKSSADLQNEITRLQGLVHTAQHEKEDFENRLLAILNSRSWKAITKVHSARHKIKTRLKK